MFSAETILVLSKVAIPIVGVVLSAAIGGRLFWGLVKHFLIKYFENQEKKADAAHRRIDEFKEDFVKWKSEEYRDAKRDFAIELQSHRESLKELYTRTDNHEEVKKTVEFCEKRNKLGAN